MVDTHLDLLDTDIPSKYFVSFHSVFKTSSRYIFKISSRHVFKTSSRHVFKTSSRHVFKTSSTRLQPNYFSTSKTSWRRLLGFLHLHKMSSSRLQDVCAKNLNFKKLRQVFVDERALITTTLISSCHWKSLVPFLLRKKRPESAFLTLTVNDPKIAQKFNDMWYYLVIAYFDWKIGVFLLHCHRFSTFAAIIIISHIFITRSVSQRNYCTMQGKLLNFGLSYYCSRVGT